MKQRHRKKKELARWVAARGIHNLGNEFVPIGYYANRPHIFRNQGVIGSVESVRFITSMVRA